jgi:hypothetical protein
MMTTTTELFGQELARQIHALAELKDERKSSLKDFGLREQGILREINRLAMAVRTGQSSLFDAEHPEGPQ